MKKRKELHLPYEILMEELFYSDIGSQVLEQVIDPKHWETVSKVPLRYKLIGLGFVKHQDIKELNENLMQHECRPLYARNSFECTLIYAFSNKISYKEWRKIFIACDTVRNQIKESGGQRDHFFHNKQITLGELEDYIRNFSEISEKGLETKKLTYLQNKQIQQLGSEYNSFFQYYASVMDDFTDVHEKARYYFCKFFYYHLLEKIKYYTSCVGNHVPSQDELVGLLPIKAESTLRRRIVEPEKLMEILRKCSLSPGALFEEFNYHFFGYVSTDWVELFLENISGIDELSIGQIQRLAGRIREMSPKKVQKELENAEDTWIVKNEIDKLHKMKETPNSRKGETAIRKYIRGDLDLDRTTLICFLLYFSSSCVSRKEIHISVERLNEILGECGYSMLKKKNSLDEFIINYIESEDPVDFLMLEMDKYIADGKNFYLYEMYANSVSNAKEIRQMILKKLI